MTKQFKVFKGQKAMIMKSMIVAAETLDHAENIALLDRGSFDWIDENEVIEFEEWSILRGRTEELSNTLYAMSPSERNTVLAALRMWQQADSPARGPFMDIANDGETTTDLTEEEIDRLCEELNC